MSSDPTCLSVTDSTDAVAIVRNFDDPEIYKLRDDLLEMGYCARIFDQEGLSFDKLSSFRLVTQGLLDSTVDVLQQALTSGIPLYLIGDRLTSVLPTLTPGERSAWSSLLHLVPLNQTSSPGVIAFSTDISNRQPGSILSGRFAEISDFTYTNAVDLARASADATPLATGAGGDLLVEYPQADSDTGQARSVSQSFRVVTGSDDDSLTGRKALFQSAACWLLRCSFCDLVHPAVQFSNVPTTVQVGEEFTFNLVVSNNGECIATATVVTNLLPTGLSLVGAVYNQGLSVDYNDATRTLIWRVGSVVSGTENSATLNITVRAVQVGMFHDSACGSANYSIQSGSKCADFDVEIKSSTAPTPPALALLTTPYGIYELRLLGQQGVTYQIETSPDLHNWLHWTNAPGPLFYLELPDATAPGAKPRFYRAHWP